MPTPVTLIGYCRTRTGAGIGTATIAAYTLINLNTNSKGASPVATTSPDSVTGRWSLTIPDVAASPTGLFSIKETNGSDVRWLEGDEIMMVKQLVGAFNALPIPDNSATDTIIGSRTLDLTTVPSGNTGNLTPLLSGLANRVGAIVGGANWYDAPGISLSTLAVHHSRHSTGQPDAIAPADIGASAVGHTHANATQTVAGFMSAADKIKLDGLSSGGGGTGGTSTSTDASTILHIDAHEFIYAAGAVTDGANWGTGPYKMVWGSSVVGFNGGVSSRINFPVAFGSLKQLHVLNGSGTLYHGSISPWTSDSSGFTVSTDKGDSPAQLRVNYFAIGF